MKCEAVKWLMILGALSVFTVPFTVFGQAVVDPMQDRLQALERSVSTLEKQVYKRGSDRGNGSASAAVGNDARADVRVGELEERVRMLNGKVEEMNFSLQNFAGKLDGIIADVDKRIAALEVKINANAARSVAPQVPEKTEALAADIKPEVAPIKPADSADKPAAVANDNNKANAKDAYDAAFDLLRQGKYEEAEKALTAFIEKYKDSDLVANAYYWLGETYYMRKGYEKAAVNFMRGYQRAPKGNKAADNLLKLAMSLQELKKPTESCTTYKKLVQEFPDRTQVSYQRAEKEMPKVCKG